MVNVHVTYHPVSYWDEVQKFLLQLDDRHDSQFARSVVRQNRLLAAGNRVRGDVAI